jgi:ComF family protein
MKKVIQQLNHWLWPEYCLLCRDISNTAVSLCQSCLETLPWQHNLGSQQIQGSPATILFQYESIIPHFIMQLKFQKKLNIAYLLGNLLAEKIKASATTLPEAIIPIPLHWKRLQERGFNQALEIAKPISKALNIPIITKGIRRKKFTQPQATLKTKERHKNMKNAFIIENFIDIEHVAILDDVVTTGQTLKEFLRALNKSSIKKIEIWCAAQAR